LADTPTRRAAAALTAAQDGARTLGSAVGVLAVVHAVNAVLAYSLTSFGIVPRSIQGLAGIVAAPFLHGSWGHLLVNSVSLVLLGAFTMVRRRSDFWTVGAIGAFVSGLGTWLIGASGSVHVGASGVIFAYLGFLMARGWVERSAGAILLSVLVTWLFGGMVWGVLPTVGAGISWEAHLFGFLGGILAARALGSDSAS